MLTPEQASELKRLMFLESNMRERLAAALRNSSPAEHRVEMENRFFAARKKLNDFISSITLKS